MAMFNSYSMLQYMISLPEDQQKTTSMTLFPAKHLSDVAAVKKLEKAGGHSQVLYGFRFFSYSGSGSSPITVIAMDIIDHGHEDGKRREAHFGVEFHRELEKSIHRKMGFRPTLFG